MNDKLVKRFVIGTFVSLYALVSIISTIHVIDFFELSNPYWLAVTLAIGFEIGAAASLASLVILKKMNKTIVWSLFIAITLMQMQGNMYYAFINLENFTGWSELFDLIEEDLIDQKRILAFVSGAILPLIALGFIKSLVDYIKPEDEDEIISEGVLGNNEMNNSYSKEESVSDEFYEDTLDKPFDNTYSHVDEDLEAWRDISNELTERYDDDEYDAYVDRQEPGSWLKNSPEDIEEQDEEFDEEHALDLVLNSMVEDMTESEIAEIANSKFEVEDTYGNVNVYDKEDLDHQEPNPTSVGAIVQKIPTPHLPDEARGVEPPSEDELFDQAMRERAEKSKQEFLSKKDGNSEA
jgi:hypothetical protein